MSDIIKSTSRRNLVAEHYFGTAEKSVEESSLVFKSQFKPFNQDEIWQKTGDYSIYETMKHDDQISVAMQLKKDLIIGSGWTIVVEDEGDEEIADDILVRLEEDPDTPLDDQLEDLIDNAYSFGFALSEKIFKMRDDNSLTFRTLKTRHPNSWRIFTDKHGNIEKYIQVGNDDPAEILINPNSLIHYVNQPAHQNPYGLSDLRAAYDAWFVKRHIIRYYSIFLEKHASPTPIARYEKTAPKDKVADVFDIIKRFQTKTAMVLPKEFEVEFLESAKNGDTYVNGINLFNMFIGRSLTLPDLVGFSGSGTQSGGSQALGREQMGVFLKHISRRRRTLEWIVNKHIVQPLVWWNHGEIEHFPKFQLKPITEDDAETYARQFIEAVKGKVYQPTEDEINHFRSLIKFPEGEVEFPAPSPFETQPDDSGEGFEENPEAEIDQNIEGDGKKKTFKKMKLPVPSGGFHKRVNFKNIEALMDSSEAKAKAELEPIIDDIFEDILEQIRKKKILGPNPHPERIDSIQIKRLSQMQKILKRNFTEMYRDGRLLAKSELPKKDFSEPIPSEIFLDFIDKETFEYVGDWKFNINKQAAIAIRNELKSQGTIEAVREALKKSIRPASDSSIDRFIRTKTTEVLNEGRKVEFEKSGAVQGYQYSAILDGNTTDLCRGLHGTKWVKGTEPHPGRNTHFNCRSVLIPILIFEDFNPDKKILVSTRTINHKDGRKSKKYVPLEKKVKGSKEVDLKDFVNTNKGDLFGEI